MKAFFRTARILAIGLAALAGLHVPADGAATAVTDTTPSAGTGSRPRIIIGTTTESLSPWERTAVSHTFRYLSRSLPQYAFSVRSYPVSELEIAVKQGEIDLFLASSGFYRRVFHRGLRDLVTLTSPVAEDPNYASGSLLLVRRDAPWHTLEDLRGTTAAISWDEGFTGYFIPMHAVADAGHDPDGFFGRLVVGGSPMRRLLEAVEAGRADVAFARACTYEELLEHEPEYAARFRPVAVRPDPAPGFRCLRSTSLFPNWTIVSTSRAPWRVSRDVTQALLSMPAGETGAAWAVVSDFARVDDLYRTLRRGPYAYLRNRTIGDHLRAWWPALAGALLLLLGLALHSWRTEILVRKRTAELREAMHKERLAQAAADEERRQKEALEQVSVVGAMSSLITHELNAPLNAIANSVRTLERLYENEPPPPMAARLVELIRRQCGQASAIVQHVRSYAKRREIVHTEVDFTATASSVARDQQAKHPGIDMRTRLPDRPVLVLADPLELELCAANLVKNAVDAVTGLEAPLVEISLEASGDAAVLTVRDHGRGTREDAEGLFSHRLQSTKKNGLGLGLMIVRTIVERTGGAIEARWAAPGLALRLSIPLAGGRPAGPVACGKGNRTESRK